MPKEYELVPLREEGWRVPGRWGENLDPLQWNSCAMYGGAGLVELGFTHGRAKVVLRS